MEKEIVNITNSYVSKYPKYYRTVNGKEVRCYDKFESDNLPIDIRKEEQIVFHFEELSEKNSDGKYIIERGSGNVKELTIEKRFIKNPEWLDKRYIFGIFAEVSFVIKKSKANYPERNIKIGDSILYFYGLEFLPMIDSSSVIIKTKTSTS